MDKNSLNKKEKMAEFLVALLFILTGIILRLVPHPPNFAPIGAIALFGGVYLSKRLALILPLVAMIISDAFIGYYDPRLMASVYGSFLLCVLLGFWLKKNKKWYTVAGSSIVSSSLFFLITNFGVWVFTPWYEPTISGLVYSYWMALPFFKNTLLGDIFYISVFFGLYELVKIWVKKILRKMSVSRI